MGGRCTDLGEEERVQPLRKEKATRKVVEQVGDGFIFCYNHCAFFVSSDVIISKSYIAHVSTLRYSRHRVYTLHLSRKRDL